MPHAVVLGGSIIGAATALLLERTGWQVTVVDAEHARLLRDDRVAHRAGAPHAVHAHGFMSRTRAELTTRLPDVWSALLDAGVERERFLVQAMVEEGVELLVGIAADPAFGPVLACGAGGTRAELQRDLAVRICPVSAEEAAEMIRSLALFPLLTGFRGAPAADLAALEELLLRVSAMVDAHREIVELDLNPVIAGPDGAVAVDARVRARPAPAPHPWPSTWKPLDRDGR